MTIRNFMNRQQHVLLLLGIKQTSALTCTSTGRQQAPAGCSGLPFLLACLLQPLNSAELKISIQPADSIFQTSPFLPCAAATYVPQPAKQAFQSYLSMLTVAEKRLVHHAALLCTSSSFPSCGFSVCAQFYRFFLTKVCPCHWVLRFFP